MYCLLRPCFQRSLRIASKVKLKYVCMCVGLVMLLDFFGAFTHLFEVTYDSNFVYPYEGNVNEFVHALRHNEKPLVDPINEYNYSFVIDNKQKCVDAAYSSFRVVYIVKSAIENAERRLAIRHSWGFENRFFNVPSKTLFLLGVHPNDEQLQAQVQLEAKKYKDIVQIDFVDTYYNNTIKTMMGFKWLVKYCTNAKFYMFVDDDIYVSVKNVLKFIRNPANYPDYLKEPKKFGAHKREIKRSDVEEDLLEENPTDNIKDERIFRPYSHNETHSIVPPVNIPENGHDEALNEPIPVQNKLTKIHELVTSTLPFNRTKRQIFDLELPEEVRLFAGFVHMASPQRHKSSKWYVPLSEYPYHLWPPFIAGGAYILSKEALLDMYYSSLYTKHFRFDDVYLGFVAKKADIEPFHCEEFHFYKKDYTKFNYKYVISSHGYGDPNELLYVWNEQKALANA